MDKFSLSDLDLGLNTDVPDDAVELTTTTGFGFGLGDLGFDRHAVVDAITVRPDNVDDRTPAAVLAFITRVLNIVDPVPTATTTPFPTPTATRLTTPTAPRIESGRERERDADYFVRIANADAHSRAVTVTRYIDLVDDFYAPRTRSETPRAPRVLPPASGVERLVSGPNARVLAYLDRELNRADANYDAAVLAQLRELRRLIEGKRSEPNPRTRGSYNRYLRRVVVKLGALGLTVDDILNRLNA